eukprot:GEMP01038339.1.p1 GENE.GEMP01038339.1~~GEMP01038339.1.p1  ORF type:complete len:160 (+),score=42.45 GEMP01038339.1:185-664(+)
MNAQEPAYCVCRDTFAEGTAVLMRSVRKTLQRAQEIQEVVERAESIANEASRKAGVQSVVEGSIADDLAHEIQLSVRSVQQLFEFVATADNPDAPLKGESLTERDVGADSRLDSAVKKSKQQFSEMKADELSERDLEFRNSAMRATLKMKEANASLEKK